MLVAVEQRLTEFGNALWVPVAHGVASSFCFQPALKDRNIELTRKVGCLGQLVVVLEFDRLEDVRLLLNWSRGVL